jgi:hypothetical protein
VKTEELLQAEYAFILTQSTAPEFSISAGIPWTIRASQLCDKPAAA